MGAELGRASGVHPSKSRESVSSATTAAADGEDEPPAEDEVRQLLLSQEQKDLVVKTWKLLEENIAKVGVITFLSLFETHPDVQSVFLPFNGLTKEDLRRSKQLHAHALKVMNFIQKVIGRINEPEKLYHLLYQLGRNHVHYGAKQQYIDFVGPQFVFAIKPSLADSWSEEIEAAWIHLFASISDVMKRGMCSVQQQQQK